MTGESQHNDAKSALEAGAADGVPAAGRDGSAHLARDGADGLLHDLPPLPPMPFLRDGDALLPPGFPLARELAVAAVAALGAFLFSVLFLGVLSDPWFQDDPVVAWLVTKLTPWDILRSGDWGRAIGAGNQLTPLLPISFWLDQAISGVSSPSGFYLHQALALAATAAVWCSLIHRLTASAPLALLATLAWLLMGSTITLAEFLAARHYLEGGFFFLLALRLTMWVPRGPAGRWLRMSAVLCVLTIAILAKEIYIVLGLSALVPFALHWRRYRVAYSTFILSFSFLYVRLFIIGPELNYHTLIPASLEVIPRILRHSPVRLIGSAEGALLLPFLPIVWIVLRRRAADAWIVLWFAGVLIAGCAVIAPVSAPLAAMFDFPSAWGRILFHLHTTLLAFVVWLSASTIAPRPERDADGERSADPGDRTAPRWRELVLVALFAVALIPGAIRHRAEWDALKDRYEAERHFYLMYPDRLVRTELAAYWYLYGIHLIENVDRVHYYAQPHLRDLEAEWFMSFDTIWRVVDGEWYRDDARHQWMTPYSRYDTIRAIERDLYRPGHRAMMWGRRPLHPLQDGASEVDAVDTSETAPGLADAPAWLGGIDPKSLEDPDAEANAIERARRRITPR